jgi:hydrogenase maturation protein HypF
MRERRRVRVQGIVQGVGFRPFVYGLAQRHGLAGYVRNDSAGVTIEFEGEHDALDACLRALRDEPPPLAMIDRVVWERIPSNGEAAFVIQASQDVAEPHAFISPDVCICDDCLRELFDPRDRRYRYPFINCTHCGPRFTIIKDIPYDRPLTTMAAFAMCAVCEGEFGNPLDRRFHAQPVACPACGPQVWYHGAETAQVWHGDAAIRAAQDAIKQGKIVGVKGIGGFHLACDATNDAAVRTLRERKGRVDKPFACMMRDIDQVRRYADVTGDETRLLTSRERPIVLVKRPPSLSAQGDVPSFLSPRRSARAGRALSDLIAPNNPMLGVMLPYSPLHYLLLEDMPPLVMTSGNYRDEPIVKDNAEALARLSPLADAFLLHDRDIHAWCDDSVMGVFEGDELPIRRSRGYAPFPIALPYDVPPLLAVGGELKATFCLANGRNAFMSQHIGDMENLETLHAFERAFDHMHRLFRIEPQVIACDPHPGYLSTGWATDYARAHGLPLVHVQHHHAHIASVMSEHGLTGPVIGMAFDGTGYGDDGAIWGGEVMIADVRSFHRVAHLEYVPLAGGDASIRRPYRMALAHLWAAGIEWDEALPCVAACPHQERHVLRHQLERNLNCAPTSSMGRLFDALASLIGLRHVATYEAQGAIELEHLAVDDVLDGYALEWQDGDTIVVDPGPLLRGVVSDFQRDVSPSIIAAKFHIAIVGMISELALLVRKRDGLNTVALSGGVFQNVRLLRLAQARLRLNGFEVLTHRKVPPNDGGLALGQAVIGGRRCV